MRVTPGASANARLSDTLRHELAIALTIALAGSLQRAGLAATGAAAPRATVRAVVTQVKTAHPVVHTLSALLLFAPITRGGITVEIEAIDGARGRRIAALPCAGQAGTQDSGKACSPAGHALREAGRAADRFAALWSGQPQSATATATVAAR